MRLGSLGRLGSSGTLGSSGSLGRAREFGGLRAPPPDLQCGRRMPRSQRPGLCGSYQGGEALRGLGFRV